MKQPEQSYTAIETAHGFVFFTDTTEGQKNRQDFLQFMADHYFDPHFNLGPVNVYRAEGVLKDGSYVNPGEGLYPEYAYLQMDKTPEMELVYRNEMKPTWEDFGSFCHNMHCTSSHRNRNIADILEEIEHTLSRISFRAQLGAGDFDGMDGTNSFVYITHMWIVGTDHSADGSNLSLIDPASPVNANSKFYTSAKWSELHSNYEADATIAQADFSLDKMLNLESPGIDISTPAAGHDARTQGIRITKASQGTAEKAVPLFKDKEYLYLIPVGEKSGTDLTQNKGCAKGDIKIGFHYDIVSKDATNAGKFIASHGEAFIELPAGHMKRKESYLYTLKINLHKIEISDATVTPWEDIKTEATVE